MAKVGSEQRPVVVRVQTDGRGREVAQACASRGWHYLIELAPDAPEDTSDLDRALNPPQPLEAAERVGRNDPCPCGSGQKFKRCHGGSA